jgi:hypothetical protein
MHPLLPYILGAFSWAGRGIYFCYMWIHVDDEYGSILQKVTYPLPYTASVLGHLAQGEKGFGTHSP